MMKKTLVAMSEAVVTGAQQTVRSTAASGSQIYESKRAVDEYLLFHYGKSSDIMPFNRGEMDFALNFTQRSANLVTDAVQRHGTKECKRVLDLGCAVGGLSFHLAKTFDQVLGIDYSHHFVEAANHMKAEGKMPYQIQKQGKLFYSSEAVVDADIDRSKVTFQQGDACNLNKELGEFCPAPLSIFVLLKLAVISNS
jgi:tRNA/tmRNA/rRNA uracil-C5-methylase (TrmA/RlmC/RlmD family)